MKFIDEALIEVRAGHGGKGCRHFRREAHVPFGGPDGGNGGRGGSVILRANENKQTLLDFKFTPLWKAEDGKPGQGARKDGKAGADVYIEVPVGTQVFDQTGLTMLADLSEHLQEFVAAEGGRGGLGNTAFKSPTNRAPEKSQPGEEGGQGTFLLSLKLVADVGLIGMPNAGKSTLISRISAARPKIADYPFTTLIPNLGVVGGEGARSFVVADIPGLIPGAHEGKGLGIRFLKHIERTKVLVHLVDVTPAAEGDAAGIVTAYDAIRLELKHFSDILQSKPELIAITKIDAVSDSVIEACEKAFNERALECISISSVSGRGLDRLLRKIRAMLERSCDETSDLL